MSYIGNNTQTQSFTPSVDYFSGTGSTTAFTLSRNVASVNQIQVFVGNVPQNPIFSYTVSGNTINFITAPASGTNNIYVYYVSSLTQTIAPSQNTVLPSSLSVSNALYWDASGNVGIGTTSTENKFNVLGNAQITGYGTVQSLNLQGGNNLLTYSQDLTNAIWTPGASAVTITANSTTAPNGTTTATTVTPTATNTFHRVVNITNVAAGTYTSSWYVQANGYNIVAIRESATTGASAVFSLSGAGSVLASNNAGVCTVSNATITAVGGSWFRIFATFTSTTSGNFGVYVLSTYTSGDPQFATFAGNGTSGIYIWCAQLELGSVASAYTLTTTAAITTTNNISVPSGQLTLNDVSSAASGSLAGNAVNLAQTWNTTGTPTAIKLNVTNTASTGAPLLIDMQVGGFSLFRVTSAGGIFPTINTVPGGMAGLFARSTELYSQTANTNDYRGFCGSYINVGGTNSAILIGDASNIVAQRNATNAQTFRLYNTYTDASNFERLNIDWITNVNYATISTANAGTGSARNLVFNSQAGTLVLQTAGTTRYQLTNTALVPATDATYDLGSSSFRVKNAYFSGVVNTSSDASINGVTVGLGGGSVSTNTAVGVGVLAATATGAGNAGFGNNALHSITSGTYNLGAGYSTLYSATTATQCVAYGTSSQQFVTSASNNSSLGSYSLYNTTTGSNLSAVGYQALQQNTIASNLSAFGFGALQNNTTNVATLGAITGGSSYTNGTYTGVVMTLSSGSTAITYPTATIVVSGGAVTSVTLTSNGVGFKDTTTVLTAPAASIGGTGSGFTVPVASLQSGTGNVAVGYQAGYSNSTGINNTFTGYQAGYNNTTGTLNTFNGFFAGYANTTGLQNACFGQSAGSAITTGNYNSCFGALSLNSSTGTENTGVGYSAGYSVTSAGGITAIGSRSGRGTTPQTTGNYSTYIGFQCYAGATNATNETVIGANAVGLGSNTTVIGNSSTTLTKTFGVIVGTNYTVATLPSASTSGVGARAFVTDALAPVFGATVVTGGAVATPVYSDSVNWKVG